MSRLVNQNNEFECFVCGKALPLMFDVQALNDSFKVCYVCVERYDQKDLKNEADRLVGEGFQTLKNLYRCGYKDCQIMSREDEHGTVAKYCEKHMAQFAKTCQPYLQIGGVKVDH